MLQCKHTSIAQDSLGATALTPEVKKIEVLAAERNLHFVLLTNRQITASAEAGIRKELEAIAGVETVTLLGETWIEDTIDAHPRLLRMVPRLYGIGDLSQILSFTLEQQTKAVLEDFTESLRTFVPTDSYRRAEHALTEHGFSVLVGPPASGKSAIAANLCMISLAQDPNVRVLRIERADQFQATWSPSDQHTLYWVDDVFGETTLDADRLKEWSAALDKVEAARKRGSRIIFCTRDYILTSAEEEMKRSKSELINDARVRVNVTDLTEMERDAIMYNHIKDGSISNKTKGDLKPFLSGIARRNSFSPELARRLGNKKFNTMVIPSERWLRDFFDHPVRHFRDIIHGLSPAETAALTACLFNNNSVPDPVPNDALATAVLDAYGVTLQEVRNAFEILEGSLLKRTRDGTSQTWHFHHPTMIEALQEELVAKSSHLRLYLQSASISAVFRDTTTLPPEENARVVFLSESVYSELIDRIRDVGPGEMYSLANYLIRRASDKLLTDVDRGCPHVIDRLLALIPDPDGNDHSVRLAARLHLAAEALFSESRRRILTRALAEAVEENGWSGFLAIPDVELILPGVSIAFLENEIESGFSSLETLYGWCSQDLSSRAQVNGLIETLEGSRAAIGNALRRTNLASQDVEKKLNSIYEILNARLEEQRAEIDDYEESRADSMIDEWKDRMAEEQYERQSGRFADVDE